MFETLFGMPLAARFIIAFIVVLALIGAAAWLVRRFAANRLGGGGSRGRQPRLAVIEAANVDARRRLLLIRRDNTEHLLMIGGPTDVVIEPNIVRAPSAREPARGDTGARADNGWPLQPIPEPVGRGRAGEDTWPPELPSRTRSTETHGGLGAAHAARLSAPELAPASPKPEPRISAPPLDSAGDQNLADMADQLEAALRREAPKPVEPPRPPREVKMRIDPRIETRSEPKLDVKPEPKLDVRPEYKPEPRPEVKPLFTPEPKREPKLDMKPEPLAPKAETKPESKPEAKPDVHARQDFYDNLEEEMASLLGRPPGKS